MIRYTDIFPAHVTVADGNGGRTVPSNLPSNTKIRAVITDEYLTFGWLGPTGEIQRLDIELQPGDVSENVTYNGGTVLGYTIERHGSCSTCGGGRKLLGWRPWPDVPMTEEPRKLQAYAQRRPMTGLIPVRYTRSR